MSNINEIFISETDFRARYQYTDKDLLGEGGFAQVYKAFDKQFQEYVALKFYSKGDQGKYDVLHEMKDTRRYSHPNIIRIHDAYVVRFEHTGGYSYIQVGILEYANGGNLRDFIQSQPTEKAFAQVLTGILRGLEYLHEDKKLIHRDLSPENILMYRDGDIWIPKIADFGISKKIDLSQEANNQNKSTQLLGKVDYMAPEQFYPEKYGIEKRISTNVDLWAFGIILYELFLQKLPFSHSQADSPMTLIQSIVSDPVEHSEQIPEPYRTIIRRCLEKKAASRFQHASEIITLLQAFLQKNSGSQKMQTHAIRTMEITTLEKRKKGYIKPMIGAGLVIVSILLYFIFRSDPDPLPPTPPVPSKPDVSTIIRQFNTLLAESKYTELISIYDSLEDGLKKNTAILRKYNFSYQILRSDTLISIANELFDKKQYAQAQNQYLKIIALENLRDRKFVQHRIDTIYSIIKVEPAKPPKLFSAGVYYRNQLNMDKSKNDALSFVSVEITNSATIITLRLKAGESLYFSSPGNDGSFYIAYGNHRLTLTDISGVKTGSFVIEESDRIVRLHFRKLDPVESFSLINGNTQFHKDYTAIDFTNIKLK
ncbi:MAG TPA: serine/threonine-protein kinase [Bacteroidales bacterium]|nr:serine/threonine-protein kinase [Bacteroidales bacterium]